MTKGKGKGSSRPCRVQNEERLRPKGPKGGRRGLSELTPCRPQELLREAGSKRKLVHMQAYEGNGTNSLFEARIPGCLAVLRGLRLRLRTEEPRAPASESRRRGPERLRRARF